MKLTMFLTVRKFSPIATAHAIESLLRELTSQTDIVAVRSDDSLGQFVYYTLTTDLLDYEVKQVVRSILNNFDGDDEGAWYERGNHLRKLRRYIITRCYICNYVE